MNPRLIGAIVGLRLRRTLRERSNLVWLILMPMVFSYLMGLLMGDWDPGRRPRPPVFVSGADASETVGRLLAPLEGDEAFVLARADTLVSVAQAQRLVSQRRCTAVLLIPPGFADSLAAGRPETLRFYHDSDRLSSQAARRALERSAIAADARAVARTLVVPAGQTPGPGEAATFDEDLFARLYEQPRVRLAVSTLGRSRYDDLTLTNPRQHSGPSYTLMFTLMFLLMSAKDIVLERHNRTLDRLRLGRAGPADLVLGFFLANFATGLAQATILLGLNSLVLGIDYGDAPGCLVLVVVLFAAAAAAAGLLLGSVARTPGQADALGMAFGLGLPALGGLWWPLEVVPPFMQTLGRSLPTGEAITVFHNMIGRGWGIAENVPWLLALGGWLVVLLVAAVTAFRRTAARA